MSRRDEDDDGIYTFGGQIEGYAQHCEVCGRRFYVPLDADYMRSVRCRRCIPDDYFARKSHAGLVLTTVFITLLVLSLLGMLR